MKIYCFSGPWEKVKKSQHQFNIHSLKSIALKAPHENTLNMKHFFLFYISLFTNFFRNDSALTLFKINPTCYGKVCAYFIIVFYYNKTCNIVVDVWNHAKILKLFMTKSQFLIAVAGLITAGPIGVLIYYFRKKHQKHF